jgi:hypothetical protein
VASGTASSPAGTPFQKLAAAFGEMVRLESRDGTSVETFKIVRDAATVEVSLSHGAPPVLVLRAQEEDPAPSSGYRQHMLARTRRRLVYPTLFFRRVTSLDRVNAMLGLRFDARTGDAAFDRAVTVEADLSDDVIAQALGAPDARAAVLEVLAAGMAVRFDERALCAELPSPSGAHLGAAAVTPVVDALVRLAAGVPRSDPSVFTRRPQPGRVITVAVVVIGLLGAGALAPGTLDDPGIPIRPLPRPIVPLPFMVPGLLAGAAAFVIAYLLIRWRLKRRNTSTDLPLVLALFVVMSVLGMGLLDAANRLLDDADIAVHEVRVTRKDTGTSRKSGAVNEWYLIVPSWRTEETSLELSVDEDLHRDVRAGDALRVTTHRGFFGWEWGAVVERASGKPAPRLEDAAPR